MHLGHGLAALLGMSGRRTRHGLTALHGLSGRRHSGAIDDIRGNRRCKEYRQECSSEAHLLQSKREMRLKSRYSGDARIANAQNQYLAIERHAGPWWQK